MIESGLRYNFCLPVTRQLGFFSVLGLWAALTLAGTNGTFNISVSGGNLTVIGATDAVNEHVNLLNVQVSPTTFDLGAF